VTKTTKTAKNRGEIIAFLGWAIYRQEAYKSKISTDIKGALPVSATPNNRFFNVYDADKSLRRQIEQAAKERDISRSQLVRHAVRKYLNEDKQPT
jgi:hypothetical protein